MTESIANRIQSIRESLKTAYVKPSPEKMKAFQEALKLNEVALDYLLRGRNLTQDTINHFCLGYDSERDAIAIPVFKRGELINIRYRLLNPEGSKYTQEKGCEMWLYNDDGIEIAKQRGGILVVEGEFDLMSVWQSGIKNVVSPSSGKDSFGVWIELLDNIPSVFIAYDNDSGGKQSAKKMAERLGVEKCKEVVYEQGIKDANDFFKKFTFDEFKELMKKARPFYRYDFKGIADIIDSISNNKQKNITLGSLPFIKLNKCTIIVMSGVSNVGKTSYALNLVDEMARLGVPSLIMPFERGSDWVGGRFIQVRHNLSEDDFAVMEGDDWDKIKEDSIDLPVYLSTPKKEDLFELLKKAKRIFDIRCVVIDHLDYLVRQSQNKPAEIGNILQELHTFGDDNNITFFVITHLRKQQVGLSGVQRKPLMEDLKDSSSLFQDPEAVVLLSSAEKGILTVDIAKNKGEMGFKDYNFSVATGKINGVSRVEEEWASYDQAD